ncbi:MAG: tRNA (N(6)-L-threonylcarbamoyladenosine(37)-C(2))-methylthiotransferase MtaB [Acidobacteriaceae bacterium]|nr:tRNA (N(6)-L-threonylcarbamoyladenosine(37)-C(2))-methylthiotransferase MtaB [Acidobacteriaceae bacterium]
MFAEYRSHGIEDCFAANFEVRQRVSPSSRYYRNVGSFYVENFGCRATQADGAAIEQQFRERGLDRAERACEAEVVVLNTCTVTAAADNDARAAIRRIHRENPNCQIVVTGCYAQRAPEEIAALPGVAQVIGNSHKHHLAEIASRTFVPLAQLDDRLTMDERPIFVSDIFAHTELLAAPVFDAANERTRPNLKVQDGCDNRCSFCVIPYVRGNSRSLPLSRILEEVDSLVAAGYREVVISGINLGRWGRDLGRQDTLPNLISAILEHTSLEKLRISSVEPMDWNNDLIGLITKSARIAKHAHVPMQSGSDRVLRGMHRKYRPWHYREKIERIRAALPYAAIGADVMVGFPGESDADFEETRRMVEALPLTYLHVFTYSPRPGTPAAEMRDQVSVRIARDRNQALREAGAQKKLMFMRSLVGKTVEAITLKSCGDARTNQLEALGGRTAGTEALTDNYLKLRLDENLQPNRWLLARVEGIRDGVLFGEVLPRAA